MESPVGSMCAFMVGSRWKLSARKYPGPFTLSRYAGGLHLERWLCQYCTGPPITFPHLGWIPLPASKLHCP